MTVSTFEPTCPYLQQVHRALPRLLALYDSDPLGDTFGLGDRTFWAWKLKDFPNATQQGAVSGLARLLVAGLLPEGIQEGVILKRINAIITGSKKATASNGSLAEALPNEGSFCVTALVAADILTAVMALGDLLSTAEREDALAVVRPWIAFLHKQDEGHGIISNHLAVAVLALVLWGKVSGEDCDPRAKMFLDRILTHRSEEGWFREYDGADPGYQSWLMSSLTAVHRLRPEWGLGAALHNGMDFLSYFAHPNGSYGGIYGSRMTRFSFPAAFEALSFEHGSAHALAQFFRANLPSHNLVTLDAIDAHNLVPLFNDYVWAAVERARSDKRASVTPLPAESGTLRHHFKGAGLLIDGSAQHYTVMALFKGGALLHFRDGKLAREDAGTICVKDRAPVLTSQFMNSETFIDVTADTVTLKSALRPVTRQLPSPFRFIILRCLSLSVFRSITLGNLTKRLLAALLVTGLPKAKGRVIRRITLGADLQVDDDTQAPAGYTPATAPTFRAIHMASQGYWQASDDAE
jgi:hypothetical protein